MSHKVKPQVSPGAATQHQKFAYGRHLLYQVRQVQSCPSGSSLAFAEQVTLKGYEWQLFYDDFLERAPTVPPKVLSVDDEKLRSR